MPSNSETILTTQTHPADSTVQSVTGDKYKGDGYYGLLVTVSQLFVSTVIQILQGTITIQVHLQLQSPEDDWFDVHTYTETSATASKVANFTGNYVWIRAKLLHTAGSVTSIILTIEVDLEHFIRVVMEKQEILAEGLNDDVFPVVRLWKLSKVLQYSFHSMHYRTAIDEFADKLVEYMTAQGYDDFDIECPNG